MYALVDCNNFYANCERLFQPWLKNTPIVVLSNNDGCVIARSQEAKNMGIKMGEPAFKIEKLINDNNISVFSSNYTLYGNISQRIMTILSTFTPEIEIYSIDEAFLSLDGINIDLIEYGNNIKNTIVQYTGIPVGIGIGPTKTLAKVANHFAKKFENNNNVFKITLDQKQNYGSNSIGYIVDCLKKIQVEDIWGIGRKYAYFLNKNAIYNGWQFVNMHDQWIKNNMSVMGLRIKKELLGNKCIPLEIYPTPKQVIATTRSFGNMIGDRENLKQAVSNFASKCAFKLRKQKSCCNAILVFLNTNKHRNDLKQYYNSITLKFNVPTNNTIEIVKESLRGLDFIFKEGFKYKKAGVIALDIINENYLQTSIFDKLERNKIDSLMKAIDYTNFKLGKEKVKLAACGNSKKWKLKTQKLSQAYTTRWDELIQID